MQDPVSSPDLSPRVRILLAISKGLWRVLDIARATGLSTSTVSKWLTVLQVSGMIERTRGGYVLTDAGCRVVEELRSSLARVTVCG